MTDVMIGVGIEPAPAQAGAASVRQSLSLIAQQGERTNQALIRAMQSSAEAMQRMAAEGGASARRLEELTRGLLWTNVQLADQSRQTSRTMVDGQRQVQAAVAKSTAGMNSFADSMRRGLLAIGGAITFQQLVKGIIGVSDSYRLVEGRLKLVTDGSEHLARTQEDLFNTAQSVGVAYEDLARLYTRIAQNSANLGGSQEKLLTFTTAVSQAFQVSGASAAEAQGAIVQLSQALASGVFRGEEFNSVAEQGPRILKALTESLGVTRGELRKMAADGKLTSELVVNAVLEQSGAIKREFGQMPMTVARAMQVLKNETNRAIAETDMTPLLGAIKELTATVSDPQTVAGLVSFTSGVIKAFAFMAEQAANATRLLQQAAELAAKIRTGSDEPLTDGGDALRGFGRAALNVPGVAVRAVGLPYPAFGDMLLPESGDLATKAKAMGELQDTIQGIVEPFSMVAETAGDFTLFLTDNEQALKNWNTSAKEVTEEATKAREEFDKLKAGASESAGAFAQLAEMQALAKTAGAKPEEVAALADAYAEQLVGGLDQATEATRSYEAQVAVLQDMLGEGLISPERFEELQGRAQETWRAIVGGAGESADALKELEDAAEDARDAVGRILASGRTPWDEHAEGIKNVQMALSLHAISAEEAAEATTLLDEQLEEALGGGKLSVFAEQAGRNIQSITSALLAGEMAGRDFGQAITDSLRKIAAELAAQAALTALFNAIGGSFGLPALGSTMFGGGRASGGPVEAGRLYEVNEKGPELLSSGGRDYLMMGSSGGKVTPNGQLRSSQGQNVTVNAVTNIDARGATIEMLPVLARMQRESEERVKATVYETMRRGYNP